MMRTSKCQKTAVGDVSGVEKACGVNVFPLEEKKYRPAKRRDPPASEMRSATRERPLENQGNLGIEVFGSGQVARAFWPFAANHRRALSRCT